MGNLGAVGVVGVGTMGWPIAQTLARAGTHIQVFDISQAAVRRAEDGGIYTAESLSELAHASDVILMSLPTPADATEVATEVTSTSQGILILDLSTNDPQTARTLRAQACQAKGDYADCPVLGRPESVGRWTIPVGGSKAAYQRAKSVLAPLAQRIVHVGESGTGNSIKVLNNLMLGTINAITAEVLVLAEAVGLDPGVFVDIVLESGAASVSGLFRDVGPRAVDGRFDPTFSLRLMHKDNALALAMANSCGVPLIVGSAAQTLNTMGLAAGHGDEDSIAVVKVLELLTGIQARRGHRRTGADTAAGSVDR